MESEREAAIKAAEEAVQILQRAQATLDAARTKIYGNQSLALVLVTDTERYVSDAQTRADRVARFLALARGKPITGRWPMVASKQREDAEAALNRAVDLLGDVEMVLRPVREKLATNPALGEAIIADAALLLARALNRIERVVRLLTEAGMGRE